MTSGGGGSIAGSSTAFSKTRNELAASGGGSWWLRGLSSPVGVHPLNKAKVLFKAFETFLEIRGFLAR